MAPKLRQDRFKAEGRAKGADGRAAASKGRGYEIDKYRQYSLHKNYPAPHPTKNTGKLYIQPNVICCLLLTW